MTALVEMSLLGTEGSVAVNSRYIQYYIVCTSRPYYILAKDEDPQSSLAPICSRHCGLILLKIVHELCSLLSFDKSVKCYLNCINLCFKVSVFTNIFSLFAY